MVKESMRISILVKMLAALMISFKNVLAVIINKKISNLEKLKVMKSFEILYTKAVDLLISLKVADRLDDSKIKIDWRKIEELK